MLLPAAGRDLGLRQSTVATALLFWHRARADPWPRQDPVLTAAACVWLASKVNEEQCSARDLLNIVGYCLGADDVLGMQQYWHRRNALCCTEQLLVRWLSSQLSGQPSFSCSAGCLESEH